MVDKYAGERGEPTGSICGSTSLLFDGYYLKLHAGPVSGGIVTQAWHARSGHKISGMFDYSVERQGIPNNGPIPEGEYWIQPSQLREFLWAGDSWGCARITIHPQTATNTYSRGGFFIHGGKVFGSIGCIDLAYGMDSFRNKIKSLAPSTSGDCTIPLTVKYAATSVGDP
ncbi:MAG: tlde1 domain-containing protein [Methylococcales bacterium]